MAPPKIGDCYLFTPSGSLYKIISYNDENQIFTVRELRSNILIDVHRSGFINPIRRVFRGRLGGFMLLFLRKKGMV